MPVTKLSDMIIPENFAQYVAEKAIEKNAYFKSGVCIDNPQLKTLLETGGKTIHMPFVKPLSGDSEIPSETDDVTINNVTTSEDLARRQFRVKAFGENQLASILSGTNVMDAIASNFADYWAGEYNKILLSTTKGVFAKCTNKVNDKSSQEGDKALFNVADAIDTKFIIGDNHDSIRAASMHSRVYAYMLKQDQISTVPNSEGTGEIKIYKPLNARIIVDDAMPFDPSTLISSIYLYGYGAIGFVESIKGINPAEIGRNKLKGMGENYLITRKQFVMHPLGIAWKEPSGNIVSPTNAQLAAAANWDKVKDDKNITLAEYKFKIS